MLVNYAAPSPLPGTLRTSIRRLFFLRNAISGEKGGENDAGGGRLVLASRVTQCARDRNEPTEGLGAIRETSG